jgi:UDP-MurNAc hydroxylase
MKVKFIYSACVEIQTSGITILTDPWFTDGVHGGSWYHFPEVVDPFKYITEPDYIYISHIHEDHYDPKFLHKLFDKYGVKPILIPDSKHNYLLHKGKSDGLILTPTRSLDLGHTELFIEEDLTDSISDVDSTLIVHDKINNKTFLNLNDCIYNESHVNKLQKILKKFTNNIDLVGMVYTAAGPFPQTYFDLKSDKDTLLEAANNRKNKCFDIYLRYAESFPSIYRLPFAGDYILGGKLTDLNEYRGSADAFEVTKFDSKALVFDAGGYVDLLNNQITGLRKSMHSSSDLNKRLKEIHLNKLDYELDFNMQIKKINFLQLLNKSSKNAQIKSEINGEYHFIFSITENDEISEKYLINTSDSKVTKLNLGEEIRLNYYSEIIIDYRLLFGLLTSIYHWNNAEGGSLFNTRRYPIENFQRPVHRYLNFFVI